MGSIRLVYDAEGDILDVDFRLTGEKPQRGIELHDNITLLSYSVLLEQPFLSLTGLKNSPYAEPSTGVRVRSRS